MNYTVTWTINVEAATPEEAAKEALSIQRDPESIAVFYEVTEPSGLKHDVDLLDVVAP